MLANSPIQFHDRAIYGAEKARFLPQGKVHKCTMVDQSFLAPLHPFHANHFQFDQPFWHFDTLRPMFHEIDQFYLLTA